MSKKESQKNIADFVLEKARGILETKPYEAFTKACRAADFYRTAQFTDEMREALTLAGKALDQLAMVDAACISGVEISRDNIDVILNKCPNYQKLVAAAQERQTERTEDSLTYLCADNSMKKRILEYLGLSS